MSDRIEAHPIRPSYLQRIPGSARGYRYLLPWMPAAIESHDLSEFDVVLSSSHCVAKGVIPAPGAVHVCYIHTPMRYAWDMQHQYLGGGPSWKRWIAGQVLSRLRVWDVSSAPRVDRFVANSAFVASRVRRYYGRDADVIHPPVDTELFSPSHDDPGEYYLMVSALVESKRVEDAVEAFGRLGRPLKIVGTGPLLRTLRRRARANVELLGWQTDEQLRRLYAGARAVIVCGIEDFGIVPLEANAMGRPVVALGRGGALEVVVPANRSPALPDQSWRGLGEPTGVLYGEPGAEALEQAILCFEGYESGFESALLRRHAAGFGRERFKERMRSLVEESLSGGSEPARPRAFLDSGAPGS